MANLKEEKTWLKKSYVLYGSHFRLLALLSYLFFHLDSKIICEFGVEKLTIFRPWVWHLDGDVAVATTAFSFSTRWKIIFEKLYAEVVLAVMKERIPCRPSAWSPRQPEKLFFYFLARGNDLWYLSERKYGGNFFGRWTRKRTYSSGALRCSFGS